MHIIETMIMSLIFEGRIHTFSPRTYLDRTELTVIRPLMFMNEIDVIGFKNKYNLPVCKNPSDRPPHPANKSMNEYFLFDIVIYL